MSRTKLVMIDDDSFYLDDFKTELHKKYDFYPAQTIEAGIALLSSTKAPILLLDITFPEGDLGLEALPKIVKRFPHLCVIMVTGNNDVPMAREALEAGAVDYFVKGEDPFDYLRTLLKNVVMEGHSLLDGGEPLAESAAMKSVLKQARHYAAFDENILITGETGTGKGVIARYIQAQGPRAAKPFVTINCGEIHSETLSSELFGHVKGAFTGAIADREGRFEAANAGMVFIDEIGELPLADQIRLLRVVEEKSLERLGSNKTRQVDVRIIAATNRNLAQEVQEGRFRRDLFYRLNKLPVSIPPLRERAEEIIPLAQHFLSRLIRKYDMGFFYLNQKALQKLKSYDWPGNVRQLENVIERAVINARRPSISALQIELPDSHDTEAPKSLSEVRDLAEAAYINSVLSSVDGQIGRAAKILDMTYQGLSKKMKKLGISLRDDEKS